jgi:CHAT domain
MTLGPVIAQFEISGSGSLSVRFPRLGQEFDLGEPHLTGSHQEVANVLSDFYCKVRRRVTLASLSDAVNYLDEKMRVIAYRLVHGDADLLYEIMSGLAKAWPEWQRATDVIPQIEVVGRETHFPFELLPLFDARKIGDFVNYAEVEDALRRFIGYVAVVRHVLNTEVETEPLVASPLLPVQLVTYNFGAIYTEGSYFGGSRDLIDLDGPWPEPELASSVVVEKLIDALYDPMKKLNGDRRDGGPVQIQHFASHGNTTLVPESKYSLILGTEEKPTEVTLGTIMTGFAQRMVQNRLKTPRPLIIANACGTAAVDARSEGSFQSWFLNNRHRGFVGTKTNVPNDAAVHFAVRLYEELLARRPIGEAIVRARRRLLAERGNPYGLFYVLYGDPELAITYAEPTSADVTAQASQSSGLVPS